MLRSDTRLMTAGALCAATLFLAAAGAAADEEKVMDANRLPALEALERAVSILVERARPSVVEIVSKSSVEHMLKGLGEHLLIDPASLARAESLASRVGSGVILDVEGHIATVASVVDGMSELSVILSDGTRLPGRLKGIDDYSGLAVISIKTDRPLHAATAAEGVALKPGSLVAAFGGSTTEGSAYSLGFLSARGVSSGPMRRGPYLKLDAYAAPGSGGGPVFDSRGRLVGLLFGGDASGEPSHGAIRWHTRRPSPRAPRTGGADARADDDDEVAVAPIPDDDVWYLKSLHREGTRGGGVSYAVPVDVVRFVTDQIIQSGSVARGWLGVTVESADEGEVLVTRVTPGSPAAVARMKTRDIIVSLNSKPVDDAETLVERVAGAPPGELLSFVIKREGQPMNIKVALGRRPKGPEGPEGVLRQAYNFGITPPRFPPPRLGVTLELPGEAERGRIGAPSDSGLVIREVMEDSPAGRGGVEEGDLLTHVMGEVVRSLGDLRRILRQHDDEKPIALRLLRDHKSLDLLLPVEDLPDPPEQPEAPPAPLPKKPRPPMKAVPETPRSDR